MMETLCIARSLRSFPVIRQAAVRYGRALGFTLIEMLVTIMVLSILMTIAIPKFQAWRERSAVVNAANTLMAHLKQARMIAVAENRSVSITFSGSSYTLDADTGSCGVCKKQQITYSQFSKKLSITPSTTRTFSSSGAVNSGTITIAIPATAYSKNLKLNIIGRAYLQ